MTFNLLFFSSIAGTLLVTVSALKCSQCKNFLPGRAHPVVPGGCTEPEDYITVTCPLGTRFCFNSTGAMNWNTTLTTPREYDAFSGVFTSCGTESAYNAFGDYEEHHIGLNGSTGLSTGILKDACIYANRKTTSLTWVTNLGPPRSNYTAFQGTQCLCDTDNCNEYIPRPLNCTQCKNFNPSIIHPIGKCSEPEDYVNITCAPGTRYCINVTGALYWSDTFVDPPQSDRFSGVFAACGTPAVAEGLQLGNLDDFIDNANWGRTCKKNHSHILTRSTYVNYTVVEKPGSIYTQINGTICICETHNCNKDAPANPKPTPDAGNNGVQMLINVGLLFGTSLLTIKI